MPVKVRGAFQGKFNPQIIQLMTYHPYNITQHSFFFFLLGDFICFVASVLGIFPVRFSKPKLIIFILSGY